MSAVDISALARVVLPRNVKNGTLAMLSAYFDDSGTHGTSGIVVVGGLVGNEDAWSSLEPEWRRLLDYYDLSAFHMTDCDNGKGEFIGWPRGKCDRAIYEFRQLILERNLWAATAAVCRPHWNEVVRPDLRPILGNPDEFCADECMQEALSFRQIDESATDIALIFDCRANWKDMIQKHAESYLRDGYGGLNVVSVTFGKAKKLIPLQAADMIAYETYRYATKWWESGLRPEARPHFKRILESCKLFGGIKFRDEIQELVQILDFFHQKWGGAE